MARFVHISGVYSFDSKGTLEREHRFSQEEQEAFVHAKAIGDDHGVAAIVERSGITGDDAQPEELRAIIAHLPHTDGTRDANTLLTMQSVRESVRPDSLIINTSNAIEELDKVTNTLAKRLREWYALYDPELEHSYKDHHAFIEAILTRTSERSADTMGGQLSEHDLDTLLAEAAIVQALYAQRDNLLMYLELTMQQHMPNIKALASPTIGAKLLSMAGSLERLSRMPSSTIQLLGAETALFRHLRNNKAKPPKHGVIFNHLLLQRATKPMRGKVARALADKISIASKIDYFKGEFIGDKLYAQVEERAKVKP